VASVSRWGHARRSFRVWSFLTLVVLTDVGVWRFSGKADDRLLGRPRDASDACGGARRKSAQTSSTVRQAWVKMSW
jgi:hypothetical protein